MTWILTKSGRKFDYLNPKPEQIHLLDIAAGLASESRFSGQTRSFYSVAQHSVQVSWVVSRELAIQGLLHDAAEAYCKDIPSPLKALLPDYKEIEHRVQAAINKRFGLPETINESVKEADLIMLATERRDLMPKHYEEWACLKGVTPLERRIEPMNPYRSYLTFIQRWIELTYIPHGAVSDELELDHAY